MKKYLKILMYVILTLVLLITMFPIFFTISSSFKTNMEILTSPDSILPLEPTWDNYAAAFNSESFNVLRLLWTSTYYTVINVIITLVMSSMGGYVFARGHFPFKKVIFMCFTALMFIKTGGIGIYATFQILNALHLPRSLWTLILLHVFSVPIVNIYLVKGYIGTLPKAIDEAAEIDGCSFLGIFIRIIVPMLKPILATIGILAFQASWNDYIMPTIFTLTQPNQRTLIVGLMELKNSSGAATSWNLMLAGLTVSLLPVLVAYGIGNKYFISGLVSGAVKG